MNLKAKIEELSPKRKQTLMLVVGGAVVLFIGWLVSPAETPQRGRAQPEMIDNVFTDRSTRDISIDAIASRLARLEKEREGTNKSLTDLNRTLSRLQTELGTGIETQRELAQFRGRLQNSDQRFELLQKNLKEMDNRITAVIQLTEREHLERERRASEGESDSDRYEFPPLEGGQAGGPSSSANGGDQEDEMWGAPVRRTDRFAESAAPPPGDGSASSGSEAKPSSMRIVEVGEGFSSDQEGKESQAASAESPKASGEEEVSTYIPMGSLLTGVLLTGLDAPTGQGARRDPFPVVLRVQKEALLPNNFRADVRECFVILSGYGELSSERVMLRSEGISCTRTDGRTIEARLEAYASGEDGKAGVRGRLVTKQGQMIAKSMTAGFFEGLAGAFDVSPVPILNTNSTGQQQFVDAFSPETVTSGLVGGAKSSLGRVADFYLSMADAMFPILELDAGRQIDLVMVRGAQLKFTN